MLKIRLKELRTCNLQGHHNQEEQKSACVKEKLNYALRKGVSLVQQDSLQQIIEEMIVEMEHLKSEINNEETTLAEHEQKLRQFSTHPDRLEALQSEILNKLSEIEVGGEGHLSDAVKLDCWNGLGDYALIYK